MKPLQYYTTLALGGICLLLSIAVIVLSRSNTSLQMQQQQQQQEINKGNVSMQIGQNLLRDMAEPSLTNEKIKQVLAHYGITVNVAPTATPKPSPSK